tara:strand:- start:127 stop:597 length:471 start_codon:yes stop_codon:yes gene_type:complete
MDKDKLIVRQVAIKSAIELASSGYPTLSSNAEIFKFAQDIEDWVLNPFAQSTNSVVSTPMKQPSQPSVLSHSPVGQVELKCPSCASKVYDNRLDKKSDKSPNFKCGSKTCPEITESGFAWSSWSDDIPDELMPNYKDVPVPVAKSLDEVEDNVSPF